MNEIDRRTILKIGVGTAMTLPVIGCGMPLGSVSETDSRIATLEADTKKINSDLTRIAEIEEEKEQRGLTPTLGATAILEATNTPIPDITAPTPSSAPEATPFPTKEEIRAELLSPAEVTPYDAGWSLKSSLETGELAIWYTRIQGEMDLDNIEEGDIRTFDQTKELVGDDTGFWSHQDLSSSMGSKGNLDKRYSWASNAKAKESVSHLRTQARDIATNILDIDASNQLVNETEEALLTSILYGLFGVNDRGDDVRVYARATYPAPARTRSNQEELTTEVAYVMYGDEKRDNGSGVLALSNENNFSFVFTVGQEMVQTDPNEKYPPVTIPVYNAETGDTLYLQVRVFDISSRPEADQIALGYVGQAIPGVAWGAQLIPPKSEEPRATPVIITTPTPTATEPAGFCAEHGGLQWEGKTCTCDGVDLNVIICADGTQQNNVTGEQCVPNCNVSTSTPDPENPSGPTDVPPHITDVPPHSPQNMNFINKIISSTIKTVKRARKLR